MTNPISSLSPETQGVVYTLLTTFALGLVGSLVEAIGNHLRSPVLVSLGKRIEALGQDAPKLAGKRSPDPALLKPASPVSSDSGSSQS